MIIIKYFFNLVVGIIKYISVLIHNFIYKFKLLDKKNVIYNPNNKKILFINRDAGIRDFLNNSLYLLFDIKDKNKDTIIHYTSNWDPRNLNLIEFFKDILEYKNPNDIDDKYDLIIDNTCKFTNTKYKIIFNNLVNNNKTVKIYYHKKIFENNTISRRLMFIDLISDNFREKIFEFMDKKIVKYKKKYIGVHLGGLSTNRGKLKNKKLQEKFFEIIKNKPNLNFLIFVEEQEIEIEGLNKLPNVKFLFKQDNFKLFFNEINKCKVLIGKSSGLVHMAGLLNLKIILIENSTIIKKDLWNKKLWIPISKNIIQIDYDEINKKIYKLI